MAPTPTSSFSPALSIGSAPAVPRRPREGNWWTIPVLCLGMGLVACCLILPSADRNRRLAYECEKLKRDLDHLNRQVEMNDEYIRRIGSDPILAERLAQRQMGFIRAGTSVLDLDDRSSAFEMSPFQLVTLPPPEPLPPYQPKDGPLAELCRQPKPRLYLMATGLMLLAMGLVLGAKR